MDGDYQEPLSAFLRRWPTGVPDRASPCLTVTHPSPGVKGKGPTTPTPGPDRVTTDSQSRAGGEPLSRRCLGFGLYVQSDGDGWDKI